MEQSSKTGARKWVFTEYNPRDAQISLTSIPGEIQFADLYEGFEFGAS